MSTAAAFSRLQLAAALLEYDNDPDNPDAPYRRAQDSAIFAHLRRNPAARPGLGSRRSDLLGVSLPSEVESLAGKETALGTRRSRASKGSIDALRNPFGADNSEIEELDEEEEGLEVDLASWGLDSFIPKERSKLKGKGKQPAPALGSTRSLHPSTNHDSSVTQPRRAVVTSKSASLGGFADLEVLSIHQREVERRRSFGSPLDLVGMEPSGIPFASRPRSISQGSKALPHSPLIPFPTSSARSPSPGIEQTLDPNMHIRRTSMASMNSRLILGDMHDNAEPRSRNVSSDTQAMLTIQEDNPFALPPSGVTSRFDPKSSRARSHSNASLGSRMMLENDGQSTMTRDGFPRDRPLSTLELLRPKVLVMPSPLQPVSNQISPQTNAHIRDGFEPSTDGPPLPPGARSSRFSTSLSSFGHNEEIPLASNSFTPNPLLNLSLSQKTFRNTLVVPGQYASNLDSVRLPRATEDGEQAELYPSLKEEIEPAPITADPLPTGNRPAGKLYGKSLIDDLESRKAQMRSKQRVFTGDQRPSMMSREQTRSSTFIDPASLQRPINQRSSSYGLLNSAQGGLSRNPSLTLKPLLNFDGNEDKGLQPPQASRMTTTRSVFGVDTLWQKEMVKLKEIQAAEEAEKEARRKKEEEEEARKKKKEKRKNKKKSAVEEEPEPEESLPRVTGVSIEAPVLPNIPRATRRVPPKPSDSDISSESDDDAPIPMRQESSWHVDSSDEENNRPLRTTGTGPRYPTQRKASKVSAHVRPNDDDSSEEDLPLVATIHRAEARAVSRNANDSDEDKPLSRVIQEKSYTSGSFLDVNTAFNKLSLNNNQESDDEDNQPLGLRTSRIGPTTTLPNGDDEDDMPLAFHPEQQRRTQYQMLAQQQQQMMLQAQLQSNMMMNASMMGTPGYFPSPIINPMAMMQMQVPIPLPSPPPVPDEAKFGLVDRWRRDVVSENA